VALARGQKGYSLAELLVVVAIFGMISAAVYWVYDVSHRTYTVATSLEDAQVGARAGIDRMASELRLIGAFWSGVTGGGPSIIAATATSITFVGDVDGDTVNAGVQTTLAANANPGVTIGLSGTVAQAAAAFGTYANPTRNDFVYVANGVTREVRQLQSVSGTTLTLGSPLVNTYPAGSMVRSVETVTYAFDPAAGRITRALGGSTAEVVVENVTGLTLTYFDGSDPPAQTADPSQVREIAISVTAKGSDGSVRTLTSRVRPRNLSL
jgi:prepilin-type N-terminal cleavage/methylation domain-containing protein